MLVKMKKFTIHLFVALIIAHLNSSCMAQQTSCKSCDIESTEKLTIKNFETPSGHMLPWDVGITQFNVHRCNAVVISTKHILTAASCILPDDQHSVDSLTVNFWISSTTVQITSNVSLKIDYVFIHENYNYLSQDFDVAILELNDSYGFGGTYNNSRYLGYQPVNLPFSPIVFKFGKLSTVIDYCGNSFRQMNVTFWPDEQCAQIKPYPHPDKENTLLCVENPCSNNECNIHDICDYGPKKSLFHFLESGRLEIIGIPKWCKNVTVFNNQSKRNETKSAIIYTRVPDFVPWIFNILLKRCMCKADNSTSVDGNELNSIIFRADKDAASNSRQGVMSSIASYLFGW